MKKIPGTTYRLQLNKDFAFNSTVRIFKYLHKLGIHDIYLSPIWNARNGSMHGYDVVEPSELNPELGTPEDFMNFKNEIRKYGFGWLQDIVPNHMAYDSENQMLTDLLENGKNSRYYNFFDIDWNHPHASVRNRILAPFLGKLYQECLENGEIKLKYDLKGFSVNYYDRRLPVKMETYAEILSYGINSLVGILGRQNPDIIKYLGIVYFLRALPSAEEIDERYYQIMFVKEIMWELYNRNDTIKESVDKTLNALNGTPGNPSSFDHLDNILREQNFRLCFWKVAAEEINYRRFFNINELISLKMEDENVYKRTHSLIIELIKEGTITGLRIDHVDGLYNPAAYLKRLREEGENLFLLVEKILARNEILPENWSVEGTTGYDFLNYVNSLFIDRKNVKAFTSVYQGFIKKLLHNHDIAHEKKRLIIRARMAGEVEKLAYLVESISSGDRAGIDITMHGLKAALEEILTFFPVYRTYITRNDYSSQDHKYIDYVIEKSRKFNPRYSKEIEYIGSILKMNFSEHIPERQKELALDFIMKFQQLTGPLMAKGFEDTALYVYNRFISLNEVGGEPGQFGRDPEIFHDFILKRFEQWKHSMNASSTHDTKRGEDMRARLNVLSEIPEEWEQKIILWNNINRKHKTVVRKKNAPERNDEYFLYQSIIGVFPLDINELPDFKERMKEYIVKAVREAKVHTAWIKPDEEYENAYLSFADKILSDDSEFLKDLIPFAAKISFYGIYNSLSQMIIKILAPGVPDIYQSSELWNFSLVDPDNRRPVDYELRERMLDKIISEEENINIQKLINEPAAGEIKMFILHKLLQERKRAPSLYSEGTYKPLYAEGKLNNNIIGFTREHNGKYALILTARFLTKIIKYGQPYNPEIWKDTKIRLNIKDKLRNIFTGELYNPEESTRLTEILLQAPFAVLVKIN